MNSAHAKCDSETLQVVHTGDGFDLWLDRILIARHSPRAAMISAEIGTAMTALAAVEYARDCLIFRVDPWQEPVLMLQVSGTDLVVVRSAVGLGRVRIALYAEPGETVWGIGTDGHSTTSHPVFVTSRDLAVHVATSADCRFEIGQDGMRVIEAGAPPDRIELFADCDIAGLTRQLAERFGRHQLLPDWLMSGAVIGLRDGAHNFTRLNTLLDAGVNVAALVCEDWAGLRHTEEGGELFWDWRWNAARHPDLPKRIAALARQGIRVLGTANPCLCTDGSLYAQAESLGHLLRLTNGDTCRADLGGFQAGIVDFSKPAAATWFAESVLHREMLELGMDGWVSEPGAALPPNASPAQGDALRMKADWQNTWAQVNAEALAEVPDAAFIMRPAPAKAMPSDAIAVEVHRMLASALLGAGCQHGEISFDPPELFERRVELAAFSPVMRAVACNALSDADPLVLAHFARFSVIHRRLLPLLSRLSESAADGDLAMIRPLFLHFADDPATHLVEDQFLLGADLMVAPVLHATATSRSVYLPAGCDWAHLWTGERFPGGQRLTVSAPVGEPPVFWRATSDDAALFAGLAASN